MGRIKIDYGIDLGTTNSALSRMENGEVVTSEIDQSRIVPSCITIDRRGRFRVGIQALNQKKLPPFIEFKRDMGVNIDYDTLDGNKTNPEKLSAELLKKLASEITDEVFKLLEWHDSYVFWHLSKIYRKEKNIQVNDIGYWKGVKGHHVFVNSELGDYMDHMKGKRKKIGTSARNDLRKEPTVDYWKKVPPSL